MTERKSDHILIVDDSPDQRFLLKMLLEAKGYTTDSTPNGEEALRFLQSQKKIPQMILLDLNMPIMGGLTFRRLQQDDPLLKNIPVVIMSGDEDLEATRILTNSDVIKKTFNHSVPDGCS